MSRNLAPFLISLEEHMSLC